MEEKESFKEQNTNDSSEMKIVNAKDVFEEIRNYKIDNETVKELLLNGDRSNAARFYFRSMLLQLLKQENLLELYYLYSGLERASKDDVKILIRKNGQITETTTLEMLKKRT